MVCPLYHLNYKSMLNKIQKKYQIFFLINFRILIFFLQFLGGSLRFYSKSKLFYKKFHKFTGTLICCKFCNFLNTFFTEYHWHLM